MDPNVRAITFRVYAEEVLQHRPLAIRTRELYDDLLRVHVNPYLGGMPVEAITPAEVRRWHHECSQRTGKHALAKAYKLLSMVLGEAVSEGLIATNPCRLKGASAPPSAERPYMSRADMQRLADAMPTNQLRAVVLTTFWAHLRLGELLALRRGDVDLDRGVVRVHRAVTRTKAGPVEKDTKTGTERTVTLPTQAVAVLREHMDATRALPTAPLFRHPNGGPLLAHHIGLAWRRARAATGLTHFHFHDLRHAGLTYVAQHGAPLRQIQSRAGHKTVRAAMIYQHIAEDLDVDLARRMSDPDEAPQPDDRDAAGKA
jgi:integrase